MKEFSLELDQRLRALAVELHAPVPHVGSASRADLRSNGTRRAAADRRPIRRPALLGTAAALTTVLASAALLSGTGSVGLPVLGVPTSDASALKSQSELSNAGVDFGRAHAIRTEAGTGAVLASPSGQRLCLYLADGAHGGGSACAPTDSVEAKGLLVVGTGVQRAGQDSFSGVAFILPLDASDPTISEAGRTTAATTKSGVVFARTRHAATLRYRQDGHIRAVALPALFPPETTVECNGKIEPLRTKAGATPSSPRIVAPEQTCP